MNSKFFSVCFVGLLLAACSPLRQNHEIADQIHSSAVYGGVEVNAADTVASMTVAVQNIKANYLCSGILYGNNMVLTAAHCLEGSPKDILIYFGVFMGNPSLVRRVVSGQRHARFTGAIKPNMGDIAVLKYDGQIPEGFKSAKILSNYQALTKGAKIVVAGFGVNSPSRTKGSGLLRKNTLRIKNPQYSATEISVDQSPINGVCSGDSGGPAFLQGKDGQLYLWGLTSNGAGLPVVGPCIFVSVFTRVDSYLPWIQKIAPLL